jgi:hypothetical protein
MINTQELIALIQSDEDRGFLPKGYTDWMKKELEA